MAEETVRRDALLTDEFYTVREVSELLKIDYETVRRWVAKGAIESDRVGPTRLIRIPRKAVQKLISGF